MTLYLKKLALALAIFAVLLTGLVYVVANRGRPLLYEGRAFTNIPAGRLGPESATYQRYAEIGDYADVDILFVGSSRVYRTYDTRIYTAAGLRTFNMGSMAQTPVNSYYLMKEHMERLSPRLVVLDVFPGHFRTSGIESQMNLLTNRRVSREMIEATFAVNKPKGYMALLASALKREDVFLANPPALKHGTYIPGGYVQHDDDGRGDFRQRTFTGKENGKQMAHLEKIVGLCREHGAELMIVSQPLPASTMEQVPYYDDFMDRMRALCARWDVGFHDFNAIFPMPEQEYYYDAGHLNQRGADVYNAFFVEYLRDQGLI
jgi:hypothetical protein